MNAPQMTLKEVASVLGISWQRVWQIERRAIRKLRAALAKAGAP